MLCVVILARKSATKMEIRSYSELHRLDSFEERFEYLNLHGVVGRSTFGFDRYVNQQFYTSFEWKNARQKVILRDEGCDLGILGYEIHGNLLIHHMNPMSPEDIIHGKEWIIDPEYLITTTANTHNAIHFGNQNLLPKVVRVRSPNDTNLW